MKSVRPFVHNRLNAGPPVAGRTLLATGNCIPGRVREHPGGAFGLLRVPFAPEVLGEGCCARVGSGVALLQAGWGGREPGAGGNGADEPVFQGMLQRRVQHPVGVANLGLPCSLLQQAPIEQVHDTQVRVLEFDLPHPGSR